MVCSCFWTCFGLDLWLFLSCFCHLKMFAVASAVQDVSQLQLSCFRFELFLISLYCRKQRGERTEVNWQAFIIVYADSQRSSQRSGRNVEATSSRLFSVLVGTVWILCKSTYLNDLFSAALCVGLSVVGRLCSLRYFDDPMMELQ